MAIESVTVRGLRGFQTAQTLRLAEPNGDIGSGLTILVGPNNGGKSTVIEAFRALANKNQSPSFAEGKRNKAAGDRVKISALLTGGSTHAVETTPGGGSETQWTHSENASDMPSIFVLPSRRYFNPYFNKGSSDREAYIRHANLPQQRGGALDTFSHRLFHALENREEFDVVLGRVLDPVPDWTIDRSDQGQYYVKIQLSNSYHTSDGMGEGLVSLLFIIDALHDSEEGDVIVIDEPELSLHPALQSKLSDLLADYASSRQIVYATHSPCFLSLMALLEGAQLARLCRDATGCRLFQLQGSSIKRLRSLIANINNPHILGVSAKETFFLQDRVILVEGQEDVVIYPRLLEELDMALNGGFFGWGVGGAGNMETICMLLKDLGFQKVVGLLDRDKKALIPNLKECFPSFHFFSIPADDVRDKPSEAIRLAKNGLTDSAGKLHAEHEGELRRLFSAANEYLSSELDLHGIDDNSEA